MRDVQHEDHYADLPLTHRSFRSVRWRVSRLLAAIFLAAAMTVALATSADRVMDIHARICALLLRQSRTPVDGFRAVSIFESIASATAPVTSFAQPASVSLLIFLLL